MEFHQNIGVKACLMTAQLLINFISKEYRIRQFFAKTSKLNTNSINALVRLGFTERAMIKNYYHYSDGHFEDAVFYVFKFIVVS